MQVTATPAKPFQGIGRHLSHSQISLFDRCQLAWFFKYVKRIEKLATVPMLLGSAYHRALAFNFAQKRITGIDLPVREVLCHFEDAFRSAIQSGGVDAPAGADLSPYREQVSRLLQFYYLDFVVGRLDPILVEHEMVCQVPGCNVVFAGILDLQLARGTIIDFKVTSRRWKDDEATTNTQATAYALLYGEETEFEFHIGLRANKKPAVQIIQARRTNQDVQRYVEHIHAVVEQMRDIESGKVDPRTHTGYCNDKICQYWRECQGWLYGTSHTSG